MPLKNYVGQPLLIATVASQLIACGGGGGGGDAPSGGGTPTSPPPAATTYSVGGAVSGLAGSGLTLQVNGRDDLSVAADGSFTFATRLNDSTAYVVSVSQQPSKPSQTCAASSASGTIAARAVTDIAIKCATNHYTLGGTVSGLAGVLVLQNNSAEALTVAADGSFAFPTPISDGQSYHITVLAGPSGQQCVVSAGDGTIDAANVGSIQLTCTTRKFSVSGVVSGLVGTGLVLQNKSGDDLTVNANQPFTFATSIQSGDSYDVTVRSAPQGHTCTVLNGTGTAGAANVGGIQVKCSLPLTLGFDIKKLRFSWPAVSGATSYQLLAATSSGFVQLRSLLASQTSTELDISVHEYPWSSGRYLVRACGSACTDSNEVVTAGLSTQAIGYFKASNTGVPDRFGSAVALSADGSTMAVGAPLERSAAQGIDGNQSDDSATDAGAVYVFRRDGDTWVQQAYIKGSNTESGDNFGTSLDLSDDGNTLAVGAPFENGGAAGINGNGADNSVHFAGAAYVFVRSGTTWQQQAYVKPADPEAGDKFGDSVALSGEGNTLAVGSPQESSAAPGVNGNALDTSLDAAGATYVYERSGGVWSQQAYVKASNPGILDSFGRTVALNRDGNTLAVGAPLERSSATGINGNQADDSAGLEGATYVFVRTSGSWAQQAYIKPSNTPNDQTGLAFGSSLALSADGNTLAVGAPGEPSAATLIDGDQFNRSAFAAGAAYVFTRALAQWHQQAYIKASNTDSQDYFGGSLALSADGSTLAVGAASEWGPARGINGTQENSSATYWSGAVYVYTSAAGSWSFESYVKASNTHFWYYFGSSIALSEDGSTLAVGSPDEKSRATGIGGDQTDDLGGNGAVYLY